MLRGNYLSRVGLTFACAVCAVVFLAGCPKPPIPTSTKKLMIKVDVSPQANKNNPVALDLVLVKDKKLFKELMKISAAEWFEKRNQYRLDYPKELGLSAGSWEWAPGQVVTVEPVAFKYKVAGGLVFANYFNPGTHRAVINPGKPFVIKLGAEGISVTPEQ
jgi:type VI secretion system protein